MNETKLTQDEVNGLAKIQEDQQALIANFGRLEYQIQTLELQKEALIDGISKLQEEERRLAATLQSKYGEGSIDLETGTFYKA